MIRLRRAFSLSLAAFLAAQPLAAQMKTGAPVPVTLGAQPIAGAAPVVSAAAPTLTLGPTLKASPILGGIMRVGVSLKGGLLARLKALAPRILGPLAAQPLDQFYTAASPAGEPPGPERPGESFRAEAKEPDFAGFAKKGAQAFYEGTLADGEYGAVVELPPSIRPLGVLPEPGEMRRRMELPTLTNPQREEKGIELYQLAGAGAEIVDVKEGQPLSLDRGHVILRQDAGRNRHNLIVVKPGRKNDKIIVVGAHHDKVARGEGKIDNWGGATLMANLYQAMKDVDTDATYVFVMFAREEEGLLGSEAFVKSLSPQQRAKVKAMLNVDSVGVDGTFTWKNGGGWWGKNQSSEWLLALVDRVAKAARLDHKAAELNGGDADSSSFKNWTHATTMYGASQEVIFDIIHSDNDNMTHFNLDHYVNTAKLAFEVLKELDRVDPPPMGGRFVASPANGRRSNGPTTGRI